MFGMEFFIDGVDYVTKRYQQDRIRMGDGSTTKLNDIPLTNLISLIIKVCEAFRYIGKMYDGMEMLAAWLHIPVEAIEAVMTYWDDYCHHYIR